MTRWTGIVLALPEAASEEMASRLVTYLHPLAGRPLLWHTVSALAALAPSPEQVIVISGVDLPAELFHDVPARVKVHTLAELDLGHMEEHLPSGDSEGAVVVDAAACVSPEALQPLLEAAEGSWLASDREDASAAVLTMDRLPQLFRLPDPLSPPNGVLADQRRLNSVADPVPIVRDRAGLAAATRKVRDRLVLSLMSGGATFLLPESVMVDVDVRIGRDSVIFPGVVLEGQTTIGEETVVGPGCRILDSWIGSGVELKGWNYISHTSIRNRAILEPYVRRGFD